MKGSVRYIITRPCLSEGSVRLLKYLESIFPSEGPITLLDERGGEHAARIDRTAGRVYGLHDLYHRHNLGVNDVLLITPLGEARYQVECVVKPVMDRSTTPARLRQPETPQRIVVSASPYVREVRLERRNETTPIPTPAEHQPAPRATTTAAQGVGAPSAPLSAGHASPSPAAGPSVTGHGPAHPNAGKLGAGQPQAASVPPTLAAAPSKASLPVQAPARTQAAELSKAPAVQLSGAEAPQAPGAFPATPTGTDPEELLRELSARIGYRFERLADRVVRLRADLATQSYSVIIALGLEGTSQPEWREEADYLAVLVGEHERPQGLPRFTREALSALLENARLAPLTPIELRGYWNAGSFDLESAASVAELVSAQLSQRGVFSFVLLSLAQQPAHSVVTASRLAERLGSGVNASELNSVLQTLASAPFSALSPLGGGQYYLRADVHDVLRGLGEYAEGLRVRLGAETRAGLGGR